MADSQPAASITCVSCRIAVALPPRARRRAAPNLLTLRASLLAALFLLTAPATPAWAGPTGVQTVQVVYVAWTDEAPMFPDGVTSGSKAIATLTRTWGAASYGKMTVAGRGWGPYSIPRRPIPNTAAATTAFLEVISQAKANGDSWATSTDKRLIMLPRTSVTMDSTAPFCVGGGKMEHEYGHVLGFPHQHALILNLLARTTSIQQTEYASNDLMGTGGPTIGLPLKINAGWVDAADGSLPRTLKATVAGTYRVVRADAPATTDPVGLKVGSLLLELRARQVYVYFAGLSYDLDPASAQDYTLNVGQRVSDAAAGLTVTTLAISSTDATFQVETTGLARPAGVPDVEKVR